MPHRHDDADSHHPAAPRRHRHRIGDLEHEVQDRHWHPVEITEIELVVEPRER